MYDTIFFYIESMVIT